MNAAPPAGGSVGAAVAVAVAVIAGGPGRRLGGAVKASLQIGGRTIAERQRQAMGELFARVLVVANDAAAAAPWQALGVELVADAQPGAGPLAGVHAALAATRGLAGVVCVGGDMPFLSAPVLQLLRDHAPGAAAVAPRLGGRPEPLAARYGPPCLAAAEALLARGERALHAVLSAVETRWLDEPAWRAVDPALRALTNVNTPDELARARSAARRGP